MTLQLFHSEFPYVHVWENLIFFFVNALFVGPLMPHTGGEEKGKGEGKKGRMARLYNQQGEPVVNPPSARWKSAERSRATVLFTLLSFKVRKCTQRQLLGGRWGGGGRGLEE